MLSRLLMLLLVGSCGAAASASAPAWEFQQTGYRTGEFDCCDNSLGTALSMRNGFAWPVIHATSGSSSLQSYSLFSATNPNIDLPSGGTSNWFPVGQQVSIDAVANGTNPRMRAATSADGQFGVSVHAYEQFSSEDYQFAVAVVGDSTSGLTTVLPNVGAIDYDVAGNLYTTSNTTPPPIDGPPTPIVDLSVAINGEVAAVAIDQNSQSFRVWQDFPLIGWASTEFSPNDPNHSFLDPASIDLQYDSSPQATPHVAGVDIQGRQVVSFDFDARTANWQKSVLDSWSDDNGVSQGVTLADNRTGTLGAAWVSDGELKYAYRDTTAVNPSWNVTTVEIPVDGIEGGLPAQTVGLAFDFNGLPMISFVSYANGYDIWFAYDPPAVVDGLSGDFNGDGLVDAADYTVWRDGYGTTYTIDDYQAWKTNFGASAAAGASTTAPEPAAIVTLLAAMAIVVPRRRMA